MAKIEIRFFGHLRDYLPEKPGPSNFITVSDGVDVGVVLDGLGIPVDDPKIILVNGVHAGRETPMNDGDKLSVFPPVAGG